VTDSRTSDPGARGAGPAVLRRGTATARRRLSSAVGALLTRAAPAALRLLPAISVVPLRRDGVDPIPRLRRLRERSPISRIPVPLRAGAWLVTGYEQARDVLAAPSTTFSNDYLNFARAVGLPSKSHPGGLGFTDPPDHTRLRRVLTPEFTGRRLQRLVPRIEAVVAEQLDALAEGPDPVDLVAAFAFPVPSLAICELLGVPYAERDDFQRLSTSRFDLGGGAQAAVGAVEGGVDYLLRIIRQQRAEPGEGLLGRLVRDHGDEFTDRELAGLADGLLTGGLETTASTIAMGALLLMQDRELFERVRTDPAAVDPFVEELLRYLSVVQVAFPRVALQPVKIGDREVKPGAVVVCSLSAANRDPALCPHPEEFDPSRPTTRHLAFGHGIHRCVGAELGKIELRAALPALVRRFPHMRLAAAPAELPFRRSSIVHGIDRLPVRLGPPAS